MNSPETKSKKNGFFDILKKIFYVLIFIQIVPVMFYNLKKQTEDAFDIKTQVGELTIKEMILDSSGYVRKIRSFLKDDDIKALLVKINSPGGVPGTAQSIFNEMLKFKEKKPIVILVENVCASAAYYIAAAGTTIISAPSALVGSIGNFMRIPNVKKLIESWKIDVKFIKTGKYKTMGSPFTDSKPEEIAFLQTLSDEIYNQFITDMAKARKLDKKKHTVWADGKIFTGTQALKLKLIDQIGSLSEAINEIKKLAKVDPKKEISFVRYKSLTGWKKLVYGDDEDNNSQGFMTSVANFVSEVIDKVMLRQQIKFSNIEIN